MDHGVHVVRQVLLTYAINALAFVNLFVNCDSK